MNNLLEGLQAHEILLMLLGSILFFALIFVLIYKVVKNQPLGKVLTLFILPVIMIGFSSFKKIEFLGLIADLRDKTEKVDESENPSEKEVKELNVLLAKVENKRLIKPDVLLSVSKANAAIGDTMKAYRYAEKALEKAPNNFNIKQYQESLITPKIVNETIKKVENNPDDAIARAQLEKQAEIVEKKRELTVNNLVISAKAYETLGNFDKAKDLTKTVLERDSNNIAAKKINRDILNR